MTETRWKLVSENCPQPGDIITTVEWSAKHGGTVYSQPFRAYYARHRLAVPRMMESKVMSAS